MTAKNRNTEKENGMALEQAMARLEQIAGLLEAGGDETLSLEKSLELYEEGSRLAAFCLGKLKDAEQRITELSIGTDNGKPVSGSEE